MRYLKKYESHEDIHRICQKYRIKDYTINSDGSIDVDNNVYFRQKLTELPLKFRSVNGHFDCSNNNLTILTGCPKSVGGYFDCDYNNLTNLKDCPKSVGGYFSCEENYLTSLVGCPKSVGALFNCLYNIIDTFEGLDFIHIVDAFYCNVNPIYAIWILFEDHTKFEFFNDCDIIREDRVIILDRLNFFLDYIDKPTVKEVRGYKCI